MARRANVAGTAATTIAAWLIGILLFFPILWTALAAFKTEANAYTMPQNLFSSGWTLENFGIVQQRSDYLRYVINTVVIAFGSTFLGILFAVPAAWSMAFQPIAKPTSPL